MSDTAVVALVLFAPAALVLLVGMLLGYDVTVTITRRAPRHRRRRRRQDDEDDED